MFAIVSDAWRQGFGAGLFSAVMTVFGILIVVRFLIVKGHDDEN